MLNMQQLNAWTCVFLPMLFQGAHQALRQHPHIWISSVIVTLLLAGAGVAGVLLAARQEEHSRKTAAQGRPREEHQELGEGYALSSA